MSEHGNDFYENDPSPIQDEQLQLFDAFFCELKHVCISISVYERFLITRPASFTVDIPRSCGRYFSRYACRVCSG